MLRQKKLGRKAQQILAPSGKFILCPIVMSDKLGVCGLPYDDNEEAYQEHLQIFHPFNRHEENCPIDDLDYYWYAFRPDEEITGVAVGCESCGTCFLLTTIMPASYK